MMARWAALGLVVLSSIACGGNVVVDHGGAGGSGEGGNGSGNGSSSGGDVCQKAVDFLEKCTSFSTAAGTMTGPCSGATECTAKCILASTCGALDGSDVTATEQLAFCASACQGGGL